MKLKYFDTDRIKTARAMAATEPLRHVTIEGLQFGFRKLYGHSIDEYRMKNRMRCAIKLLRQTDKSIKEIARLTGYKNLSSFNLAFKQAFKQQPTQWRNVMAGIPG